MTARPIQLTDAAFLMLRKAIAKVDANAGLQFGAADIVAAAELVEAEYAAVRYAEDRIELRATLAGGKYMKMIDALLARRDPRHTDPAGERRGVGP